MSSSGAGFYIGVPVSPTTERERQGLAGLLEKPAFITGSPGSGKTATWLGTLRLALGAEYEARGLPLDAQPDADEQDGGTLDGGAQDGSHA